MKLLSQGTLDSTSVRFVKDSNSEVLGRLHWPYAPNDSAKLFYGSDQHVRALMP